MPRLGDWGGPVHGELGVLATDAVGEKVQCHICGAWKTKLGLHIWWEHDKTSQEYRALFGLKQSTGLAGPVYKAAVRAANSERLRRCRPRPSWVTTLTPEQRSALRAGTELPLETLRDPRYQEARARVGALTTARARVYPCGCGCGEMLPPGNGPHRGQRYRRGHVPPSIVDRVWTVLDAAPPPGQGQGQGALSCADLFGALPGEEQTQVRRALVKLVRRGRAVRVGRGHYRAVATPADP